MLTVATVQVGNYLGRGKEYLSKFYSGIIRHMPANVAWRGVCFTDDPSTVPFNIEVEPRQVPYGLTGWWNKLALFRANAFEPGERVLYSDLDVIPIGGLGDIASYAGRFAALRDPYHPKHLNSSLMAWEAGELNHIWDTWDNGGRPEFDPRGDQHWIETMQQDADYWQDLFPDQVVSFKVNCWLQGGIPENARVLMFHGLPRPHQCQAKYVKELWNQPPERAEQEIQNA